MARKIIVKQQLALQTPDRFKLSILMTEKTLRNLLTILNFLSPSFSLSLSLSDFYELCMKSDRLSMQNFHFGRGLEIAPRDDERYFLCRQCV